MVAHASFQQAKQTRTLLDHPIESDLVVASAIQMPMMAA
jgi:hypothetical protein